MSALPDDFDSILDKVVNNKPHTKIEYALYLLWNEVNGFEKIAFEAAAELAALRAERDALKDLLKEIEWSCVTDMGNFCPKCHAATHRGTHFDDCELAAALKGDA